MILSRNEFKLTKQWLAKTKLKIPAVNIRKRTLKIKKN